MTNAEYIRKMGNTDLTYLISRYFKDRKRCEFCAVGIDQSGKCNDPKADCDEGIFEFLGKEIDKDGNLRNL